MGYRITTLKNLPAGLSYYFFLVGDYRNRNPINDLFRADFNVIADRLGEDAAIIEKTERSRIESELIYELERYVFSNTETSRYFEQVFARYPGLFITKQHPYELTDSSQYLHLPFSVLERSYSSTNELLNDLVFYARQGDMSIISKTTKKYKLIKSVSLSLKLGVIALNFGF